MKYKNSGKKRSFKDQIRGVQRYLRRDDLSAEARATNEKKLKQLQLLQQNRIKTDKEKKISKQYHGIKFFEKKKVLRKQKRLQKRLTENAKTLSEKEKYEIQTESKQVENQLIYITHFPKGKKYVALFPNKNRDDASLKKLRKALMKEALSIAAKVAKKEKQNEKVDYSDDEDMNKDNALEEQDDFFTTATS
jgi:hypothetical protein